VSWSAATVRTAGPPGAADRTDRGVRERDSSGRAADRTARRRAPGRGGRQLRRAPRARPHPRRVPPPGARLLAQHPGGLATARRFRDRDAVRGSRGAG
jgi:hypothetical protein